MSNLIAELESHIELLQDDIKQYKHEYTITKDIIKSLEHDVEFWKNKSRGITNKIDRDKIVKVLKKYDMLKKIIIEELKRVPTRPIEFNLSIIANNIISKIPEPVITSPITEDDIVEVLRECFITGHMIGFKSELRPIEWEANATDYQKLCKQNLLNQYAKEILGKGEKWEVVASGRIELPQYTLQPFMIIGNDTLDAKLFEKYDGKEIEIAVRELPSIKDVDYISACPKCNAPLTYPSGKCSNKDCDYVYKKEVKSK